MLEPQLPCRGLVGGDLSARLGLQPAVGAEEQSLGGSRGSVRLGQGSRKMLRNRRGKKAQPEATSQAERWGLISDAAQSQQKLLSTVQGQRKSISFRLSPARRLLEFCAVKLL